LFKSAFFAEGSGVNMGGALALVQSACGFFQFAENSVLKRRKYDSVKYSVCA
jgi:hypothetical protein